MFVFAIFFAKYVLKSLCAALSFLSRSGLFCPSWPGQANLSDQPVQTIFSGTPVLVVLSKKSYPKYPVTAVRPQLTRPGGPPRCHFLAVMFWPPVLSFLSYLYYLDCPPRLSYPARWYRSCCLVLCCPVPTVLPRLSCAWDLVLVVLSLLSCHISLPKSPVHAVMFLLPCPGCAILCPI